MIHHCQKKEEGKTIKGKIFRYLSDIDECWDLIMAYIEELQIDAGKWRAQQAEQEAVRLAEEKRQADIAAAEAKLVHYNAQREKHHQQYLKDIEMINEAERELHNLRGE